MFRLIDLAYLWLWTHTTGVPYTTLIRGSWHQYPLPWVFLVLGIGSILGHLFW